MIEQDTIKLLRECDSGIKMGVSAIDEVLKYVHDEELKKYLQDSLAENEKIKNDLETAAYQAGQGNYLAPAQRVEDFLAKRPSTGPGRVIPSYRPGVTWTNLWDCLPDFVAASIAEALPILGRKLKGYDQSDAVLTAVESRSSSPVRLLRNNDRQSPIQGLYPCGEGGGWAGGILSAAADGMRCGEEICKLL